MFTLNELKKLIDVTPNIIFEKIEDLKINLTKKAIEFQIKDHEHIVELAIVNFLLSKENIQEAQRYIELNKKNILEALNQFEGSKEELYAQTNLNKIKESLNYTQIQNNIPSPPPPPPPLSISSPNITDKGASSNNLFTEMLEKKKSLKKLSEQNNSRTTTPKRSEIPVLSFKEKLTSTIKTSIVYSNMSNEEFALELEKKDVNIQAIKQALTDEAAHYKKQIERNPKKASTILEIQRITESSQEEEIIIEKIISLNNSFNTKEDEPKKLDKHLIENLKSKTLTLNEFKNEISALHKRLIKGTTSAEKQNIIANIRISQLKTIETLIAKEKGENLELTMLQDELVKDLKKLVYGMRTLDGVKNIRYFFSSFKSEELYENQGEVIAPNTPPPSFSMIGNLLKLLNNNNNNNISNNNTNEVKEEKTNLQETSNLPTENNLTEKKEDKEIDTKNADTSRSPSAANNNNSTVVIVEEEVDSNSKIIRPKQQYAKIKLNNDIYFLEAAKEASSEIKSLHIQLYTNSSRFSIAYNEKISYYSIGYIIEILINNFLTQYPNFDLKGNLDNLAKIESSSNFQKYSDFTDNLSRKEIKDPIIRDHIKDHLTLYGRENICRNLIYISAIKYLINSTTDKVNKDYTNKVYDILPKLLMEITGLSIYIMAIDSKKLALIPKSVFDFASDSIYLNTQLKNQSLNIEREEQDQNTLNEIVIEDSKKIRELHTQLYKNSSRFSIEYNEDISYFSIKYIIEFLIDNFLTQYPNFDLKGNLDNLAKNESNFNRQRYLDFTDNLSRKEIKDPIIRDHIKDHLTLYGRENICRNLIYISAIKYLINSTTDKVNKDYTNKVYDILPKLLMEITGLSIYIMAIDPQKLALIPKNVFDFTSDNFYLNMYNRKLLVENNIKEEFDTSKINSLNTNELETRYNFLKEQTQLSLEQQESNINNISNIKNLYTNWYNYQSRFSCNLDNKFSYYTIKYAIDSLLTNYSSSKQQYSDLKSNLNLLIKNESENYYNNRNDNFIERLSKMAINDSSIQTHIQEHITLNSKNIICKNLIFFSALKYIIDSISDNADEKYREAAYKIIPQLIEEITDFSIYRSLLDETKLNKIPKEIFDFTSEENQRFSLTIKNKKLALEIEQYQQEMVAISKELEIRKSKESSLRSSSDDERYFSDYESESESSDTEKNKNENPQPSSGFWSYFVGNSRSKENSNHK